MTDSHLTAFDGYQARIFNILQETEQMIRVTMDASVTGQRLVRVLEDTQKKLKRIELSLKVIANCLVLYASEFMKSTFNINMFDDPLTIE